MPARTHRGPRRLALASTVTAALFALTACAAGQDAETTRETPDVAGVDGGVGTLLLDDVFIQSAATVPSGASVPLRGAFTNNGQSDEHLVSVSTPAAASVQLPDTTGAVSSTGIDIPAEGSVDATTGTVRLQLMDVTAPIQITQLVPVTFVFGDGEEITLDVPVSTADQGNPPATTSPTTEVSAG
jgi:periplasmic copper chaperone A